jgi:hypothetical protein
MTSGETVTSTARPYRLIPTRPKNHPLTGFDGDDPRSVDELVPCIAAGANDRFELLPDLGTESVIGGTPAVREFCRARPRIPSLVRRAVSKKLMPASSARLMKAGCGPRPPDTSTVP